MFAAVVIAAIVVGVRQDWLSLKSLWTVLIRIRDAHGTGVIYTLLLAGVAAIGLPITPLLLIGGVLFGITKGTLISWAAVVAGAVVGYYLARRIGKNALRRVIERLAGRDVKFSGKRARRTLIRLRLAPFTPFGAVNFAAGLAGMPFRDYLLGTALGSLPSVAIITYFASQVLTGGRSVTSAISHALIAAGVLWALTYAPKVYDRLSGDRSERNGLNPEQL